MPARPRRTDSGRTRTPSSWSKALFPRLGVALPDELKVLYGVTRARWQDWGEDYAAAERVRRATGCELFALDDL